MTEAVMVERWPATLIVFATFRCNQHCGMCGQEEVRLQLTRDHPEADFSLLDTLGSIPPSTEVHFSGGEALLVPGMRKYAAILSANGVSFTMTTNGLLLRDHEYLAEKFAPEKIIISIDSLDPDTYGALRGVSSESLGEVLDNVRWLRGLRTSAAPLLKLNLTVQPANVDQIMEVVSKAKDLGFDQMSVSHLQWNGGSGDSFHMTSNATSTGTTLALEVDTQRLGEVVGSLPDWVDQHPPLGPQELGQYYKDPDYWLADGCSWPRSGCYVMPDGKVFSCATFQMGDLRDESLPAIWQSNQFRDFRSTIDRELLPECRTCCHLQFERNEKPPFIPGDPQ